MKILITGGAGFIGSHLAEKLLEINEDVIILDNFNHSYHPAVKRRNIRRILTSITLLEQSLEAHYELTNTILRLKPDVVLHLAAYAGVRPSWDTPTLYSDVNITATANLLNACRQNGVEKFIFASSSSVYGIGSDFRETSILQPISPYAASKVAGEALCHAFYHGYGLPCTCLRFFTVYGPRQRPEMAIHKFTRMIDAGEEIPVYDNGKSSRDYTHVDDIVDGIIASIVDGNAFEIYNLGNSIPVKLTEVITLIEGALGKKAKIRMMPHQPGDVPTTKACITKAQIGLSYFPRVEFKEGIRRFVDWYKAN